MHVVIIKVRLYKNVSLYKPHLCLIWHCFNKAKIMVQSLDSLLHPKRNKKRGRKREVKEDFKFL